MIEIRRILCPTDFSEFSVRALQHAVPIARWYGAKLTALHVLPLVPSVAASFPTYVDPMTMAPIPKGHLLDRLREFVAPADEAGVDTEILLLEGHVTRTILSHAEGMDADLIVMGSHGREGFEHLMLGSVAEKVLRKAECPVLSVGREREGRTAAGPLFGRIVCPVDFSAPSKHALDYALSLAQEAKARLDVLHVVDWGPEEEVREHRHFDVPAFRRFLADEAHRRLRDIVPVASRDWCEVEEVVASGKPYAEILRVARERDADLIVMGVRGRSALNVAVFGSTANQVVRGGACPVLTVREG
ncbi:MAG TPA: universal stress protein [Vicinamibacteria bacterium]